MEQQKMNHTLVGAETSKYPMFSMVVAVLLMMLKPFLTSWLAAVSFVICLYRVIRYDARVFAVDYAILIPIAALMKLDSGTPLAIYLAVIAGVWYFVRGGAKVSGSIVVAFLLLLNYLLTRMQMNINDYVMLLGQMFMCIILVSKQDSKSAEMAAKAFCISMLISSVYAFLFRNTSGLERLTGMSAVSMFGTSLKRFCGLAGDPNYFMTYSVVGIALVLKLRDCRAISRSSFWVQIIGMSLFGVLTYSKAFLLMYVCAVGIYIIWQFWNRKLVRGMFISIFAVVALIVLMTAPNSPFAVIINRLTSARSLGDLTTGRTRIFAAYWEVITASLPSFFFGQGMAADALYRDPHMVYLEAVYYLGFVGTGLLLTVYVGIFSMVNRHYVGVAKQNLISKYIVLVLVLVSYLSLHGLFTQVFHAQMFLAALGLMVTGNKLERTDD